MLRRGCCSQVEARISLYSQRYIDRIGPDLANNLSGALHSLPWTPHAPIAVAEALAFIRAQYGTVVEREDVAVGTAIGRVLGRDLVAPVDLPRFDASAVDGYAIRTQDRGLPLKIVGRSAAGHPIDVVLGAGEAVRIFTGAAVPAGADRVVMQEDCAVDGATLKVLAQGSDRRNIRRRGEDRRKGDIALTAGRRVTAGQLALAAALGLVMLPVYRPLKVALFSSGDEVHSEEPDSTATGAIVDANRPLLGAAGGRNGHHEANSGKRQGAFHRAVSSSVVSGGHSARGIRHRQVVVSVITENC